MTHGSALVEDECLVSLLVPLPARHGPSGALALAAPLGRYGEPDLVHLEAVAALTSVALESARLIESFDGSQHSWEETVDAISLALCILEPNGRIRRANRAFAALIDVPAASIVGRPWIELLPPGWAEGISTALALAAISPDASREVHLRASDRSFSVTAFPLGRDPRGPVVVLFEDQTDRRRLQDQLIQSEKMSAIGQLIAGVAHDLNNPLTSVIGFADFLLEAGEVPPRMLEPLRVVQQEAERAASIVKNLLSFARKQEHRRRHAQIRPLLNATLGLLRNQLMAQHVEARLECDAELPDLDLDTNQIQQVFVNLINNAAQAIATTGRPGTISIHARPAIDGIAVDIVDDGPGMTPDLAAKVFEPFFTTKPEGAGTGLGLSISQGIVKEHGGRITLTTAPGEGATFTVELPCRSQPAPEPAPRIAHPELRPLHVLVVDDEPHILHYIRTTLEAWGHGVQLASDGHEALERAVTGEFDLIISDLRMPRLGGREFYEELQRRQPAIARRVVFSTGDTVRGDTLAFLEQLGRPYLHKPFSLSELRNLFADVSRAGAPAGARGE
jgi:two-component system NtrC family sensor kinase